MSDSLEFVYRHHHGSREREGFSILEEERGSLFKDLVGTGKKVLDIGCRDGTLTRHFAAGNEVTGADVDTHALARAEAALGIRTVHLDLNAENWPLERDGYDVVVAAEVLEHVYYPERVLGRVHEVLRPGGIFVGSVPNAFSLKCRLRYLTASKRGTPLADPMHIGQFGWHEFRHVLEKEFSGVRLYPIGRKLGGLRDAVPAWFSYGIGFQCMVR